jgi:hypothetical protein
MLSGYKLAGFLPRQGQMIFLPSSDVQTGSGGHSASYPLGTGGPFPGGKARPGRDADHSPDLVERSRTSGRKSALPPRAALACSEMALHYKPIKSQNIAVNDMSEKVYTIIVPQPTSCEKGFGQDLSGLLGLKVRVWFHKTRTFGSNVKKGTRLL